MEIVTFVPGDKADLKPGSRFSSVPPKSRPMEHFRRTPLM